jgi:DNA repair protein RAD5
LEQWRNQLLKCCADLRVLIYHGDKRHRMPKKDLAEADVIISTLLTLQLDQKTYMRKQVQQAVACVGPDDWLEASNSVPWEMDPDVPALSRKFQRVIYDEAHSLKPDKVSNYLTQHTPAVWALTGTPLSKELDADLWRLLSFVHRAAADWKAQLPTWTRTRDYATKVRRWSAETRKAHEDGAAALLKPLMVRHLKNQKYPSGRPVISMPAVRHHTVPVKMEADERAVYHWLLTSLGQQVQKSGPRHMTQSLGALAQLRQFCSHPQSVRWCFLKQDDDTAPISRLIAGFKVLDIGAVKQFLTDSGVLEQFAKGEVERALADSLDCPICMEEISVLDHRKPVAWLKCGHTVCIRCARKIQGHPCPMCRQPFQLRDVRVVAAEPPPEPPVPAASPVEGVNTMNRQDMEDKLAQLQGRIQTPKVAAILQKLREIRHAEPDAKAVIFGQWKGTQDMVAKALEAEGVRYCVLSGETSAKARASRIQQFQEGDTQVFLASLRTTATGINLTAAHHILFADVCTSPDVVLQAQNRCHRVGQEDTVHITTFVTEGTVEQELQARMDRKNFVLDFPLLRTLFGLDQ